jgi:hyperosmotically inducible periplasmic protein
MFARSYTMRRLIQAFVVAVAVGSGVAGCAVTKGQESTGQYVDDATITTHVKARFAKDPTVSAMHIHVDTMKGVVQLSGSAKTDAERRQAETLASTITGVKEVKNDIKVESASSDATTNR